MINIQQMIFNAAQMQQIETQLFDAQMPVAALMEKVAGLLTQKIVSILEQQKLRQYRPKIGILVGPGHNGGDGLVVARELFLQGYSVCLYAPLNKRKDLTESHWQYAQYLGIPILEKTADFLDCDCIIDGLFGFGLTRDITGELAQIIEQLNDIVSIQKNKIIISIDIPSGIHTDTGAVLGTAIKAHYTFCLGLWKRAFFQDRALGYVGKSQLIDFGIPNKAIETVLSDRIPVKKMTLTDTCFPLPRPPVTHKYHQGHLLLICGSKRYAGGAVLTGLGAMASGVGMLSVAVPASLKPILVQQLPQALIIDCPETATGAIASLPDDLANLAPYSAIACGPGLSLDAQKVVQQALEAPSPLILDADALNLLAQFHPLATLSQRTVPTILTPHIGEFKRLFPDIPRQDTLEATNMAAEKSGVIVLLKGARTAIASPKPPLWVIGESTPALARGGSGDVLTGLIGGIIAQPKAHGVTLHQQVATAAWWHAKAALDAAQQRTELGVDAYTLAQQLIPTLQSINN